MNAMSIEHIARWTIGLAWIYHGLVPKLISIAPIEYSLNSQLGFSETVTLNMIRLAGVAEVIFGVAFIKWYRHPTVIYLNMAALAGLLVLVGWLDYRYWFDGFNPVTTNIPLLALSWILLLSLKKPQ